MTGLTTSSATYTLTNERSLLQFTVPLLDWSLEAQADCRVSANSATVNFIINSEVLQCPDDFGLRQQIRVLDELFVANQVRSYTYVDKNAGYIKWMK